MKRFLSLAAVTLLAGSMFAVSVDTADAHNGRRGALIAGLIIGGVTATILASQVHAHRQPQYYMYRGHPVRFGHGHMWNQHVQYCYGRYRSYNHHTNLFLAYSGNYRHCRSPWIR
ncbi:BA14K family protein [Ahrensia marina]|jgi:hypothetical protein|uniref:BA14K family protein n=1 Tax=Ahrensia marina TaxID=1514904 RepID=UPI0035CF1CB5